MNGKRSYGGGYMLLSSSTTTYVDENGVTYTYTYTDYSNGGHPPIDKGSLILIILAALVVFALAAYHFYRAYRANKIKKVCVEQIPALIVRIDGSRGDDDHYRYRYRRYNATYRYDYNGRTYSCRNRMWGDKRTLGGLKQSDTTMINICPGQPEVLFDRLGECERRYFLANGILQTIAGIAILLMIIFRDRL